MEFKWEIALAGLIIVCATVALVQGALSEENWVYVLILVLTFLGGAGYGYMKAVRRVVS